MGYRKVYLYLYVFFVLLGNVVRCGIVECEVIKYGTVCKKKSKKKMHFLYVVLCVF